MAEQEQAELAEGQTSLFDELNDDPATKAMRAKQAKAKKSPKKTASKSHGLTPFDVNNFIGPADKSVEGVTKFNDHLNQITPPWLSVWITVDGYKDDEPDSGTVVPHHRVDTLKYGFHFLETTKVATFPALMEGAIYQPQLGAWRTFGKGENRATVESRIAHELLAWGVYYNPLIQSVRTFIGQIGFNEQFGKGSPFDHIRHPEIVAFANGAYNIVAGKMIPNSPSNYLLNAHSYKVDPDKYACPETEKRLTAMMADAMPVFEEFVGYMFYQSYAPFQEFMWISGNGGEGKSELIREIKAIIGVENVSAVKPAALADSGRRFETSNLYGKEANIMADVGNDYLKSTDILKSLTGGDSISAEFKGIQNFVFTNYAKLLFSANEMPAFSDHTSGFADRVLVVPLINGDTRKHREWWNQFDQKTIEAERPQFAMKCMRMFAAALERGSFTKSPSVEKASQAWLDSNDHFKEFLDENAEIDTTANQGEASTVVTAEYKRFCQNNNYLDKTTTQAITKRLDKMGVKKMQSRSGWLDVDHGSVQRYIGLKLTGSPLHESTNV